MLQRHSRVRERITSRARLRRLDDHPIPRQQWLYVFLRRSRARGGRALSVSSRPMTSFTSCRSVNTCRCAIPNARRDRGRPDRFLAGARAAHHRLAETAAGQPARVLRGDLPGRGGGARGATGMVAQSDERRLVRKKRRSLSALRGGSNTRRRRGPAAGARRQHRHFSSARSLRPHRGQAWPRATGRP